MLKVGDDRGMVVNGEVRSCTLNIRMDVRRLMVAVIQTESILNG